MDMIRTDHDKGKPHPAGGPPMTIADIIWRNHFAGQEYSYVHAYSCCFVFFPLQALVILGSFFFPSVSHCYNQFNTYRHNLFEIGNKKNTIEIKRPTCNFFYMLQHFKGLYRIGCVGPHRIQCWCCFYVGCISLVLPFH